jgi:hypothetical protein
VAHGRRPGDDDHQQQGADVRFREARGEHAYTINTVPGDKEWQVLFGKLDKPNQWGIPYQPALELGKAPMTHGKAAKPVEQVTISIDDTSAGGTLRIEWGTTSATAPFKVG